MARNRRLTVTLTKETDEIVKHRAAIERRTETDVAKRLLRASARAMGMGNDLAKFTRQLEGEEPNGPEVRLDPAELRVKSQEELGRLDNLLNEIPDLLNALSATAMSLRRTLEAEAHAARLAKTRRLRGATLLEVRS